MDRVRINKRAIDGLMPTTTRYVVFDDKLPAFGVEVMPTGVKSYKLWYRKGGRLRKLTIGRHGAITAEEARDLAKKALGAVANGADPADEKSEARRVQTLAAAFEDWLERHVEAKRKPTTQKEYRRLFQTRIKGHLGSRRLTDVDRADVMGLHRTLSASPYVANRTVAVLRAFFTWCERQGLRPLNSNPARLVEPFREVQRERMIAPEEFARLGATLKQASKDEWPWAIAAIMLLLFTGARRGEILTLRWQEIDLEAGVALTCP